MINGAIYRIADGAILQTFVCPESCIADNVTAETEFYLNCPPDATHIINNEPVTIAPPSPTTEELLARIRATRDYRLSACDWTQTLDAPLTIEQRAAWTTYRQAMRDFPETCDPENPGWPVAPI